jgi:hypothetical protein
MNANSKEAGALMNRRVGCSSLRWVHGSQAEIEISYHGIFVPGEELP